ncbi:hypothetical protein ACFX11_000423 [Malus domestica]
MGAVPQVHGAAVATALALREAHTPLQQARRQEKAQPFQNPTLPALVSPSAQNPCRTRWPTCGQMRLGMHRHAQRL